jgi:hypothetical protein
MAGADTRARRVLSSPLLYGAWAVFVVCALVGTYPVDPYVYGFTALGLAWLTGALTIVAVAALGFWGWEWTWTRRLVVIVAMGVSIAAVAQALAILRTFRWA